MILAASILIILAGIDPQSDSCSIYEMIDVDEGYDLIAYIDQPSAIESVDHEVTYDGRVIYLSADCENEIGVSDTVYVEHKTVNLIAWYRWWAWWNFWLDYNNGEG